MGEAVENDAEAAVDAIVRLPSNTLLQSQAMRQAWDAKEERRRIHTNPSQVVPTEEAAEHDAEVDAQEAATAGVQTVRHTIRQAWRATDEEANDSPLSPVSNLATTPLGQTWLATEAEDARPQQNSSAHNFIGAGECDVNAATIVRAPTR